MIFSHGFPVENFAINVGDPSIDNIVGSKAVFSHQGSARRFSSSPTASTPTSRSSSASRPTTASFSTTWCAPAASTPITSISATTPLSTPMSMTCSPSSTPSDRVDRCAYVCHSVSAMIGILASIRRPELFTKLVLVGASPR
ncbi:hypothetical protein FH972_005268 [Carpinus fangiana]|uniref:AB hydrolase-1 domain-containing protein n=1 Tax=Carpinus fangiana TaxID=176857 RepID=A0A5N6QS92_9ROSI|nr:hypothetical protein FH972_005268 [Carpinus fangiana]